MASVGPPRTNPGRPRLAKLFSRTERASAMAERRKISAAERKERDALTRVRKLVLVMVIRRLFDDGWTTEQVALAYEHFQRETGGIVIAYSTPGW